MADFTNREVKVFDLLTVLVMVEQCEPDLTMVVWSMPERDRAWNLIAGKEQTCCLSCLFRVQSRAPGGGRAAVVDGVKTGLLQVHSIHPRCELNPCNTCAPHRRF